MKKVLKINVYDEVRINPMAYEERYFVMELPDLEIEPIAITSVWTTTLARGPSGVLTRSNLQAA